MSRVEVHPYNPEWPRTFERLRAELWPVVQHASLAIEHVGSTSVPGLAAKPVIDLCIVVASPRDIPFVVKPLVALGYTHQGELGVPDRHAFRARAGSVRHHLYASPRKSLSLRNHLGVRDYLRAHPEAEHEYGALKQRLAQQFPDDIDSYIDGKTEFVLGVLAKVGLTESELSSIRQINELESLRAPRP